MEIGVARMAAAIGEPARARMLYSLLDGHARTSTELAIVAEVSPSTASVHLARLAAQRLVQVLSQGRHRYYSLAGPSIARAMEALTFAAAGARSDFVPSTPSHLRSARTCYDHMAGRTAVELRERLEQMQWLAPSPSDATSYEVTRSGSEALGEIGIDVESVRGLRRRFAYACVDWSERCPHIGGALGHAILSAALSRRWFVQDLDSRALTLTPLGRRQLKQRFGLQL